MIEVTKTPFDGLLVIKPRVFTDDRGYFMQSYHLDQYVQSGLSDTFVQDNEAMSAKGVLRGLHYQVGPYAQSKLVRVIQGSVYDVAVDIRPGSKTFGRWFGLEISAQNKLQLYIPTGFAHGYLSLEDETIFAYKCGALYSPNHEGGIRYDDPQLAIDWPGELTPIVSDKDFALPYLGDHLPANS